jgi:hypothetical protein
MAVGAFLVGGFLVGDRNLGELITWGSVVGGGSLRLAGRLASSKCAGKCTLWARGVRGQRVERLSGRHLVDRCLIVVRVDLRCIISNNELERMKW